jgi:hypothetical protein
MLRHIVVEVSTPYGDLGCELESAICVETVFEKPRVFG